MTNDDLEEYTKSLRQLHDMINTTVKSYLDSARHTGVPESVAHPVAVGIAADQVRAYWGIAAIQVRETQNLDNLFKGPR